MLIDELFYHSEWNEKLNPYTEYLQTSYINENRMIGLNIKTK